MPTTYRYPESSDLSTDILIDAYKILSSREFTKKNASIIAKHEYVIQGVLQNQWFGEPDTFGAAKDTSELNKILENPDFKKLEGECVNLVAMNKRFGGEGEIQAGSANLTTAADSEMDPATILMFVDFAMKLIKMIRERKKK